MIEEWPFKYFKKSEFSCKCGCGFSDINPKLVQKLEYIREILGIPLKIHSGCRCEAYNTKVGGKKDSAHLRGNAADVGIEEGTKRYIFLRAALLVFKRMGIYGTFCHVDVDEDLPQMVVWVG